MATYRVTELVSCDEPGVYVARLAWAGVGPVSALIGALLALPVRVTLDMATVSWPRADGPTLYERDEAFRAMQETGDWVSWYLTHPPVTVSGVLTSAGITADTQGFDFTMRDYLHAVGVLSFAPTPWIEEFPPPLPE